MRRLSVLAIYTWLSVSVCSALSVLVRSEVPLSTVKENCQEVGYEPIHSLNRKQLTVYKHSSHKCDKELKSSLP